VLGFSSLAASGCTLLATAGECDFSHRFSVKDMGKALDDHQQTEQLSKLLPTVCDRCQQLHNVLLHIQANQADLLHILQIHTRVQASCRSTSWHAIVL
jgi:hypothetical protein